MSEGVGDGAGWGQRRQTAQSGGCGERIPRDDAVQPVLVNPNAPPAEGVASVVSRGDAVQPVVVNPNEPPAEGVASVVSRRDAVQPVVVDPNETPATRTEPSEPGEQIADGEQSSEPGGIDGPAVEGDAGKPKVEPEFQPHDGQPWWTVVSTWVRRAIVAIGGGGLAILLAVLTNRLLIKLGYPLQHHPEVGGTSFTVVAFIAGAGGALIGMVAARHEHHLVFDRFGEFSAAVVGSLLAIYLGIAIGSALGAFSHVHFHPVRVSAPLLLGGIVLLVKSVVDWLWPGVIGPRVATRVVANDPAPAERTAAQSREVVVPDPRPGSGQ